MQRRMITLALALGFALMFASSAAMAQYQLENLSSNQVGWAHRVDPLLVNAWGLVHGPGTPWWISDNNSGWLTLYNGLGKTVQQLKVVVPTAGENGPGLPTGIVFNGSQDFQVQADEDDPGAGQGLWPSIFLCATLDGTISGWAPQSNFNQAIVAVNNSSKGAVYTGLAVTSKTSGNRLYAADVANNKVDIYDATFTLLKSFTDTTLPTGFAPFGINDINGLVYVTFASTTGGTGGFVDVFTEDGVAVTPGKPLISGLPLNQPWGIAVAPAKFGPLSNTLLISNNTNQGVINGFDIASGKFVGTVKDSDGKPIHIDQLWGIGFGDGSAANGRTNQLFFTAGPSGNQAGTFGLINFKP